LKKNLNEQLQAGQKRPVTFKLNGLMWLVSLLFCIISH
jgi:hypothetical protein